MLTDIQALIVQVASEEGVPPTLALAMAEQESNFDPFARGDGGDSLGLYQLNIHGLGSGLGDARYDPETNARVALRHLAQTLAQRPELGGNPGALAAASQRPYDPAGYAVQINGRLDRMAVLLADGGNVVPIVSPVDGEDTGWPPLSAPAPFAQGAPWLPLAAVGLGVLVMFLMAEG